MAKTSVGNPRGLVEQDNPNICAKVKLCLCFIYSGSKSSLLQDRSFFIKLASTKLEFIRLKTSLRKQTKATVSNYKECIYKIHRINNLQKLFSQALPNFKAILTLKLKFVRYKYNFIL